MSQEENDLLKRLDEETLERLLTLAEDDPDAMSDEDVVLLLAALYAAYPRLVKTVMKAVHRGLEVPGRRQ